MNKFNRNYRMAILASMGAMCAVDAEVVTEGGGTPAPTVPTVPAAKTKEQIAAEAAAKAEAQKIQFAKLKEDFAAKNALVDVSPVSFFFKSVKEKDKDGKEIPGMETKRPTIELPIPVPSYEGIVAILEKYAADPNNKEYALLRDALQDYVASRARELINEDEKLTAENFPFSMLTWEAIANLPQAERRGGGIAKETWEEFVADYIAVMQSASGASLEAVQKAASLFAQKFASVKTNKPVLNKLKVRLAVYAEATKNAEQFTPCIEFLLKKADTLLAADEQELADFL